MRRVTALLARMLPWTGLLLIGGCGVTSMQLRDFGESTVVMVAVSALMDILQAIIIGTSAGA